MTIKDLDALLLREVNYAKGFLKERSLYKGSSVELQNRIVTNVEKQIVHLVLSTRYFDEDINKFDLGISDQVIEEIIARSIIESFSIFSSNG